MRASCASPRRPRGGWQVHQWLKKAVLLSFRLNDMVEIPAARSIRARRRAWWDKVPSKFAGWASNRFRDAGFRAVPGAIVRRSAYIAPNVVLMPSFVNVGAYVDSGTMVDTWATVGSCAQIGKNCHLSGGVGIGGVLEPLQAEPVIIEDDCFIGARSEVVEGVIVEQGAVLAMGIFISATTKIVDRDTGEIHLGRVPAYSVVVPGSLPGKPLPDGSPGPSLYCAVIVKTRRRADPRQDLDQRVAARMMKRPRSTRSTLAAELIRAAERHPEGRGRARHRRRRISKTLGFTCHRLVFGEPGTTPILNLYARRGSGGRNFCFAGHTDVVPPGARDAWSFDPFAASVRDGALYGRGAVDMKGAIAAFVAAAERFLAERGAGFAGSISLLITGDEEGGGDQRHAQGARLAGRARRAARCLRRRRADHRPPQLGDMVKIGRRGSLTGRLTVARRAGPHRLSASRRQRRAPPGRDAARADHRRARPRHRAFPALDPAGLDDRYRQPGDQRDPGRGAGGLQHPLQRSLDRARRSKQWLRRAARCGRRALRARRSRSAANRFWCRPAMVSDPLAEAIRRVTGRTPELSTTGGTSDARFIHAYCPVAEFGLVGQTMHKVDERVDLADLAALTEIYRTFLDLFFGNP